MAVWRSPVRLTWSGSGSPGANVWHIRTVGPDHAADAGQALAALETFYTAIASDYPSDLDIDAGPELVGVSPDEEDQVLVVSTFHVDGTTGTGKLPPSNQVVISWRTEVAARRGMGRTFLGPLAEVMLDPDGTIATVRLQGIRDAATALLTASLVDNGWALGVWGLEASGGATKVLRDFTSGVVRDQFAVLRSRRD